jgi:hypothetical protein
VPFFALTNPIPYGSIIIVMRKEVDMVEVGTKIIGNFGAMIPLSFGEVVTIESFEVGPREREVIVKWDNGPTTRMMESEINAAVGKLSPKAAALLPIGYYTEKVYYET